MGHKPWKKAMLSIVSNKSLKFITMAKTGALANKSS